jgi:hypothetical protein
MISQLQSCAPEIPSGTKVVLLHTKVAPLGTKLIWKNLYLFRSNFLPSNLEVFLRYKKMIQF